MEIAVKIVIALLFAALAMWCYEMITYGKDRK
jgi:hypothetical protein